MKKISSSNDNSVQHVIYDCNEVVPFHENVGLQLAYMEKEGYVGRIIAVLCVDIQTKEVLDLLLTLENGIFYRHPLNHPKLNFIQKDEEGKIKLSN